MPSFPQTEARCENRGLGTTGLLRHPFGRSSGWRTFDASGPDGQNPAPIWPLGPDLWRNYHGLWHLGGYFAQQHGIICTRENERGNVVLEKQRDGHFHATVVINGAPIDTLVDTGATLTVLTPEDATRAGFDMDRLQFSGQARTANGIVATAPVRLDRVALGPFEERNVRAAVNGGNLDKSLLGMEFLNRFGRLEITRDQLIITK